MGGFSQADNSIRSEQGYLKIGPQTIAYARDITINGNTAHYSGFEYEQRESATLKVKAHNKYFYVEDPDTGELVAVETKISETISVNDFYGELLPSETKEMFLSEPMWLTETGDTIEIESYELIITTNLKYVQFGSCEIYINGELNYELNNLQEGDYIVLRRLESMSSKSILGLNGINGYWKIK